MTYKPTQANDVRVIAPGTRFEVLTPSNSTPLPAWVRGLHISAAGNLVFRNTAAGSDVPLGAFTVGSFYPYAPAFLGLSTTATVVGVGSTQEY
jgi:hypothetical protein